MKTRTNVKAGPALPADGAGTIKYVRDGEERAY